MFHKELRVSCHQLLDEGVKRLDLPIGIVSHIYSGLYTIISINSEVTGFVAGAIFPLNNTYCRDVFESGQTKAITDIEGVPGMRLHPLYLNLPLEAYIGAPIFHNGSVWGTINFSSTQIHAPFTSGNIALVESYAHAIGAWLDEIDAIPAGADHCTHVASRSPFSE
ncbi:MAG: GAF domain-containing protein [Opitutaceae bacterium]